MRQSRPSEKLLEAKQVEIDTWTKYGAYEEVPYDGQTLISTRWVITEKAEGKIKARLVIRGYEEPEGIQSDSPTASKSTLRIFLAMAQINNWDVISLDIKCAFLQGNDMARDLFIMPPEGFGSENTVWKLKKCMYGLRDGSRSFYFSLRNHLTDTGCKVSDMEPTLYYYKVEGVLQGCIVSHVDDLICAGGEMFERGVLDPLKQKYTISKLEKHKFTHTGLSISQNKDSIEVSMSDFARKLSAMDLVVPPEVRDLNPKEYTEFRGIVGRLNWLSCCTRPDLAFKTVEFSTKFQKATTSDLKDIGRCVKKVEISDYQVRFPKLEESSLKLVVYTDASLGNLNNGGSCGGYITLLVDKNGNSCPINWQSGRLKRVCNSTLGAETLALVNGLDDCMYNRDILEVLLGRKLDLVGIVDNRSLVEAIGSTSQVSEKRLRREICAIKDMVAKDNLTILWVPTVRQLADILTKSGVNANNMAKTMSTGKLQWLEYDKQ